MSPGVRMLARRVCTDTFRVHNPGLERGEGKRGLVPNFRDGGGGELMSEAVVVGHPAMYCARKVSGGQPTFARTVIRSNYSPSPILDFYGLELARDHGWNGVRPCPFCTGCSMVWLWTSRVICSMYPHLDSGKALYFRHSLYLGEGKFVL